MIALLLFDLLSPLNELLIQCHIRDPPRQTFTDGLKTVKGPCNDIPGKENPTLANANRAFNRSFDEPFGGLVDDLPCPLSHKSNKNVRIAKNCDRAKNLVDSLDELFDVKF